MNTSENINKKDRKYKDRNHEKELVRNKEHNN